MKNKGTSEGLTPLSLETFALRMEASQLFRDSMRKRIKKGIKDREKYLCKKFYTDLYKNLGGDGENSVYWTDGMVIYPNGEVD